MGWLELFRPRTTSSHGPARGEPQRVAEVQAVLDELRPLFRADGGDMQLVAVEQDGRVVLAALGACHGCSVSRLTLEGAVVPRLRERCVWFAGLELATQRPR